MGSSDSTKITTKNSSDLIKRSNVPPNKKYPEYRNHLRWDFFYSCAYCTITEFEAQGLRLTIDHYEPRNSRPDLEHEYLNLMYACDPCNIRKGDRSPPQKARDDGYRFFRPDNDYFEEHFSPSGIRLESNSTTGYYTIESLDLNRQPLRRLREIRQRIYKCNRFAVKGISALRKFHIDRLPRQVRSKAIKAINNLETMDKDITNEIDQLLRKYAHSPLVDDENDSEERQSERTGNLENLKALYPGKWRAPRNKKG